MRALPFTTRDELASSRRWLVSSMLGLMALGLVAGYSANVVPALREGGAVPVTSHTTSKLNVPGTAVTM